MKAFAQRAVHKNWDVFDTADLLLHCDGDINLSIHMDFLQPYFGRSIEVYGTESAIRWRDNEPMFIWDQANERWNELDANINWDHVYRDEIIHFISCLNNEDTPIIDAVKGLELMKIIEACENNARNK